MNALLLGLALAGPAHAQDPCNPPPIGLEDLSWIVSYFYEETRERPDDPSGFCPEDLSRPLDLDDADARAARLSQGDRDTAAEFIGWIASYTDPAHVQGLANAAALLDSLLGAAMEDGKDYGTILDALLQMAADTTDPLLHRQIALNLWRRGVKDERAQALIQEYLPRSPDYGLIFPEGQTTIEATLHTGDDGFKHSDFKAVFERAGAKVTETGHGDDLLVEYTVKPDDPALPEITWRINVRDAGWPPSGVLDEFVSDDKNVAMYGNHSQLGTAIDRVLSRTDKNAQATDFYWMDACKSKVFASRLSQAYPKAHITYTKDSEYFHDMPRSFQRGLVALTNHYTYEEMRRYVASGDVYQGRNYYFPDDQLKLAFQDQDADGIADSEDRIFDVAPGYDGELASRAVHIANTYMGYSGAYGKSSEDMYRPGGVFDGEKGGPYTRIEERRDAYGNRRYFVSVSDELLSVETTQRTASIAKEIGDHWADTKRWSAEKKEAGSFLLGAAVYDVWSGSGFDTYARESIPDVSIGRSDISKYLDDHDFVTSSKLSEFMTYVKEQRGKKS